MYEDNTSESVGSTITPFFVVEISNSKSILALRLLRIDAPVGEKRDFYVPEFLALMM